MSSRTAAARKRIREEPTKEPKEPKGGSSVLKRGFFSRSKSAAPPSKKERVPTYPSPPPSTHIPFQREDPPPSSYKDVHGAYSPDMRFSRSDTPRNIQPLNGNQSPASSKYGSPPPSASYPSPQEQYRPLNSKHPSGFERLSSQDRDYGAPQGVKKAASTSNMLSSYQNQYPESFSNPPSHVFLEASYQPPPPPRPRNGRPLPNNPATGQPLSPSPYPPEKVPSPSTPYAPLPSPAGSPALYSAPSPQLSEINIGYSGSSQSMLQSSLLLQPPITRAPPSPVDLPQYGQPQPPPRRRALQITTQSQNSHWESNQPRYEASQQRTDRDPFRRDNSNWGTAPYPQEASQREVYSRQEVLEWEQAHSRQEAQQWERATSRQEGPQRKPAPSGHDISHRDSPLSRPARREVALYPTPPNSDVNLAYLNQGHPDNAPPPVWHAAHNEARYPPRVSHREQEPEPPSEISYYSQAEVSSYAASTTSSSSRRSSVSQGSKGSSKKSSTFVFPGSRSIAKPKITSTGKTRLNLAVTKRSKSRAAGKGRELENDSMSPPDTPLPMSPAPPSNRSKNSVGQSERPTQSSASSMTAESSGTNSSMSHTDPTARTRKASTATSSTGTRSKTPSSSAPSIRSNPGFIYPGGRSRARPSAQPLTMPSLKFKKKSAKSSKKLAGSALSDSDGRTRFMGITIKKNKSEMSIPGTPPSPLAFTLLSTSEHSGDESYGGSQAGSTTSSGGPAGPEIEAYRERQRQMSESPEVRRQERVKRIKSRIGSYPLDPYDTILLDNDRHTGDFLNRLNGTGSPSFYEYGSDPPATVLDLGCGQGHWVVDAAIAWKGHGTKVTGYDMVDISKVLLPWAIKQGVADNIRFVRGNFLKQRLPFNDNSFDLVRMSSLTLCITADAWIFVFQEVCRVLSIGGRLELIDDSIIFPYGKPALSSMGGLTAPSTPQLNMFAPRLDINIPSSAFSTFCIYEDSDNPNPGLGFPEDEDDEDRLDLYQVKEEGESDMDDTATLSGREPDARIVREPFQARDPRATPVPRDRSRTTQTSSRLRSWTRQAATSRDLEALFEHMLTHKFGMHMRPEEFVLDLMKDVFGHAREVRTMHLSLAPPDVVVDEDAPRGRQDEHPKSHDRYGSFGGNLKHIPSPSPARTVKSQRMAGTPLSRSPGLVLSPSTFIPMTQHELEIHASKHLRMLLSCKKFLVEHAMEATEDEEIDEDSVLEAFWEYEGFLRARFNHPPDHRGRDKSPSQSDNGSIRGSIISVSSEGQDAMWEYQSELRQRFAWPLDGTEGPAASRSQITPKIASSSSGTLASPAESSAAGGPNGPPQTAGHSTSPTPSIAPPYSRSEMTHVRTFRVYEAIKLDEAILVSAA